MKITFGERTCSAAPGHRVIIPSGAVHRYGVSEPARFQVADVVDLPEKVAVSGRISIKAQGNWRAADNFRPFGTIFHPSGTTGLAHPAIDAFGDGASVPRVYESARPVKGNTQ